jgi:Tol biopolymer transport system component
MMIATALLAAIWALPPAAIHDELPTLEGDYLSQPRPGDSPELFASFIVAERHHKHSHPAFSPDGDEVWFSVYEDNEFPQKIYFMRRRKGLWTPPQLAPFSGQYQDGGPVFSADGSKLFFYSKRPRDDGGEAREDSDIWYLERTEKGWSEPVNPGPPLNTSRGEYPGKLEVDGTIHITVKLASGNYDLFRSTLRDGAFSEPTTLGAPINTPGSFESDPQIVLDGKALMFTSFRRTGEDDLGIYLSFKRDDGRWSQPRSVGDTINEGGARFPGLSPDGSLLFFTSLRSGNEEYYWVDASVLDDLEPAARPAAGGDLYLGQKPPGEDPELFGPGLVSTGLHEHSCPSFSPDGREVLWTSVFIDNYTYAFPSLISTMRFAVGNWSVPVFSELSEMPDSGEAAYSPDGKAVFFSAPGPPGEGEEKGKLDIWVVRKTDDGWTQPENLGLPINTPNHEGQPSVTSSGTLYFKGHWEGGQNDYGIYRSRPVEGRYGEPELLPDAVNSAAIDWTPFVAPDESYLLFSSLRPGGFGSGDLYVSFRTADDSWTPAVNLGSKINDSYNARYPCVSPDGRYLFFVSDRVASALVEGGLTREELLDHYGRPGNGWSDVYWVDAAILERLAAGALSR